MDKEIAIKLLMSAHNFSPSELVSIGTRADRLEVWNEVIERLNLDQCSPGTLLEWGLNVPSWPLAVAIIQLNLLSTEHKLRIASVQRNPAVWSACLACGNFSADDLMKLGRAVGAESVWINIIRQSSILSADQLCDIGVELNSPLGWIAIIQTGRLPFETLLDIGEKMNRPDVWEVVINAVEAKKYAINNSPEDSSNVSQGCKLPDGECHGAEDAANVDQVKE